MVTSAFSASVNPFAGNSFYVNPANSEEYDSSITTATGEIKTNLEKMQKVGSAYWIDVKAKIHGNDTRSLEGILKDASSQAPAPLVVFIWYDLPNRDCNAKASNGEICCTRKEDGTCDYLASGDCADGIHEYKTQYVDPFIAVLKEHAAEVPIAVVIEPDSLPNLATNIGAPSCGNEATQAAYKTGISYAVQQLTTHVPSVAVYLGAAHGGWLGWADNLKKFLALLKSMELPMAKVRGFATNVANYQPLGVQCPWEPDEGFRNGYCLNGKHGSDPCCEDPCKLEAQYNPGNNEMNYAAGLVAAANAAFGTDLRVVIDTGRNGVGDMRAQCSNWCNIRGAGAGIPSTARTANSSYVDAYYWLKTPGESDGCTEVLPDASHCARFDSMCGSADSIGSLPGEPHAPEAGKWFDYQVKQLAANARFSPAPAPQAKTQSLPTQQSPGVAEVVI